LFSRPSRRLSRHTPKLPLRPILIAACYIFFLSAISALKIYAINYSTATDTTDTDFNAGLVKSSVTVKGTGAAAYVEISTVQAIGGTITYSGEYTIHTFTSNGTFTPNTTMAVEYLVVGGGGGGSGNNGGGGGGGGVLSGSTNVTAQGYNIIIGNGGIGTTSTGTSGTAASAGQDTTAFGLTAGGGGYGGHYPSTNAGSGRATGGSGGGSTYAGANPGGAGNGSGGTGGYYASNGSGGGGGYGNSALTNAPAGANGVSNSINGTNLYWAAGGGGTGLDNNAGNGGLGGGGGGGSYNFTAGTGGGSALNSGANGTAGTPTPNSGGNAGANTGSGGGGGGGGCNGVAGAAGGNGGSGIVIVRYLCYRPSAELQSRAIDTGSKGSKWGQVSWGQSVPAGTSIKLKTRTGDTSTPDGSWSAWSPASEWFTVNTGTPIASPRARYIQYISSFTTSVSTSTPQLLEVNIQYATNTATSPNLISPADSVWISSTQPVFKWNFVDDESDSQTGFRVQIATHTNKSATSPYGFTGAIANDSGDTSSGAAQYQPPGALASGAYYWLVRTSDTYGAWSVYSSTYCVKIDTIPPSGQTVISFASGVSSITITSGGATDSGGGLHATPYYVEISTSGNFGGNVYNSGWIAASYTFTGLLRNKRYYCRVRSRDVLDNVSGYSSNQEWRTKPGAFQSKSAQGKPARTGPNSFGFVGDAVWEWDVPVKAGAALTITAYIRYNTSYGGSATKPKLTLSGRGITTTSISATGAAQDAWELITINAGTPTQNATLNLRAEGFSNSLGAEFYIDDINVSQ